jgi:RNA polymerase sigma-70 factor (ECF subfamily)
MKCKIQEIAHEAKFKSASARVYDMNWDFVIPAVNTADAVQATEPAMNSVMNSEQFAAFYERSARPLWAYLARVSADPALADDLMQESYVRFLCAASPCDGEVESRRYLFRIATNLLHDHWRRPNTTSIDELPEDIFVSADISGQLDSWALLKPAMARLRPRDRQLLWLAHAENYSHHEIAHITGLGVPSIRLLLFRARRKIAKILKQQGEHPNLKAPNGLNDLSNNDLNKRRNP